MVAHRLIIDRSAPGPWNMAVDEALLMDAADNGVATLRLYQWSEPTLSLGYFQRYDDRQQHGSSRECAAVRRQTGGGAILHDRELTYSLTLPASHPLARQSQQLYAAVHDAFIAELENANGANAQWSLARRDQESSTSSSQEPFLCFERRAPGDVVLIPSTAPTNFPIPTGSKIASDYKILGSAQRRHGGAILQHGSLLLERSPAAPELPGVIDLSSTNISVDNLSEAISRRLAKALDLSLLPAELPPALQSIAQEITNSKYGAVAWTKRR